MKKAAAFALLLLAGCATGRAPYAPVRDVRYQALGAEPFWLLAIGDDRIVLRSTLREGERIWPRTLPRSEGGARIWQSGEGPGAILIEARAEPCATESGQTYEDHVRVRLDDLELSGCGGRLVRRERR